MNRTLTAALLVTAAVTTNAAFTALGTVFDYPDVLQRPVDEILVLFRGSQGTVTAWFTVMALSAALFAPIAVGVGRLSTRRSMRLAVPVGIAAAFVQVIGLSRWPLLVPRYARDALSADPGVAATARESFSAAHNVLGTLVGETVGYSLTAAWTLLVLAAVGRLIAGRWFTAVGVVSAVLIAAGVLTPLGVPLVDTANFVGYVLWSAWLIAFAVVLARRPTIPTPTLSGSALSDVRS